MLIDPAALARNISQLATLDAERDLMRAMQQIASAAKALLRVDGAGLMLADERGQLRWATASDQQIQIIEQGQERLGEGPCVNAFLEHAPMAMRDAAKEPQWGKLTDVVTGQEMRAGLSVPVQLEGGPIGTLDLYSAAPRDWDQAEISAAQVYAALAATLLSQAVGAQVKGRLAEQLQTAFAHRTRIERAKGMLMVQEEIDDAAAFERLRSVARSSRKPLIDVVNEVLGGRGSPALEGAAAWLPGRWSPAPAIEPRGYASAEPVDDSQRRRFHRLLRRPSPCRTEAHWSAAVISGHVRKEHSRPHRFPAPSVNEVCRCRWLERGHGGGPGHSRNTMVASSRGLVPWWAKMAWASRRIVSAAG
jgi:GAF domain-containing protein